MLVAMERCGRAPRRPPVREFIVSEQPRPRLRTDRLLWGVVIVVGLLILYVALRDRVPGWIRVFSGASPRTVHASVMHTTARITIVPSMGMKLGVEESAELALAAVRAVENRMNAFDPESDVGRLNGAPAGAWVSVDPLTWRVVMEALRFHCLTDGAFDATVGPLMGLYAFSNAPVDELPSDETVAEMLDRVGSDKIRYEREGMKLALTAEGMRLDLGGIAKGFAVDQAVRALAAVGVEHALVEIGGEVRVMGRVPEQPNTFQQVGAETPRASRDAKGKPPSAEPPPLDPGGEVSSDASGRPWRIGVRHPRDPNELMRTLELTAGAVATSGDYEKFFECEGERYSHILDPRTGLPVQGGVVSAMVLHPESCLKADALATAFSVMGEAAARTFMEELGHDLGLDRGLVLLYVLAEDGGVREVRLGGLAQHPSLTGGHVPAAPQSETGAGGD